MYNNLISLGNDCQTRIFLAKSRQTFLFDWVASNWKAVYFALTQDSDDFLSLENWDIVGPHTDWQKRESWDVRHKWLHISARHDVWRHLPVEQGMLDFVARMKRRFHRIKEALQVESNIFVHTHDDVSNFANTNREHIQFTLVPGLLAITDRFPAKFVIVTPDPIAETPNRMHFDSSRWLGAGEISKQKFQWPEILSAIAARFPVLQSS